MKLFNSQSHESNSQLWNFKKTHTRKVTYCNEFRTTAKLEGTVPKATSTSHTNCKPRRVPKTLRFNNLLEESPELMKVLVLTFNGLLQEKDEDGKQSQKYTGQSPWEIANSGLPLSFPHQVMDMLLPGRGVWQYAHSIPSKGCSPVSRVQFLSIDCPPPACSSQLILHNPEPTP